MMRKLVVAVAAIATLLPAGIRAAEDARAPVTRIKLTPNPERGVAHGPVTVTLIASDTGSGVARTQYRIDNGRWRDYAAHARTILDPNDPMSFSQWHQAGSGAFVPLGDGTILSVGGLGMLWYTVEQFGYVAITLQWRDARLDSCCSNSGVFVRFPNPEEAITPPIEQKHDCQSGYVGGPTMTPARVLTEWVAIYCGHEIQINDGASDPQKTGSVYNFKSLSLEQARPITQGEWNDYEIRTVGRGSYRVTVIRNGTVINQFVNTPGQESARVGDPPTDDRQFARGYIGVQNHLAGDFVQFRDIKVRDLSPAAAAFTISARGRHTISFRSIDWAGNVEKTKTVTVKIKTHR